MTKEKLVTRSYAQALLELGNAQGIDVVGEITKVTEAINSSNDLENVLFLEVFTIQEKQAVLNEVLERLKISSLVKNFFSFLSQEKRLGLFPLIFKETIVIDDHRKGFIKGAIEGSDDSVDPKALEKLSRYMEKFLGKKIQWKYKRDKDITSGYRLYVGSVQLDITIDNQLEQFKKTGL